jgi:low affinity Fe/Cu permease
MGWSDTWQLLINTPTTVVELFLGFLTLAAANRVEKRNREINERELTMLQHQEAVRVRERAMLAELAQHVDASRGLHKATQQMLMKLEALVEHINVEEQAELALLSGRER